MRHISRLINLISEDKPTPFLMGQAEGQRIKVRFDRRGEFNVIRSSAVEKIETNVRRLKRFDKSKNIPACLKSEKKIKFKAVKMDIIVFQLTTNVEAMILNGDDLRTIREIHNYFRQLF